MVKYLEIVGEMCKANNQQLYEAENPSKLMEEQYERIKKYQVIANLEFCL